MKFEQWMLDDNNWNDSDFGNIKPVKPMRAKIHDKEYKKQKKEMKKRVKIYRNKRKLE